MNPIDLNTHGGPDAQGVPRYDFSTNANACGPCPVALAGLRSADSSRYPDPAYTALRQRLAALHGVEPARVLLAASASEAIGRITAWAYNKGVRQVQLPAHPYADYVRAAQVWGLQLVDSADTAVDAPLSPLVWCCEPSSPLGQAHSDWPLALKTVGDDAAIRQLVVLDRAYAPLRLSGTSTLSDIQLGRVWQLFSPNKALGLTGIRAAYVIAPSVGSASASDHVDADIAGLQALAPSWPVGAHGVAMLQAWAQPETQAWLASSLHTLRRWKARQIALLEGAGWTVLPSQTNFFCARPPRPLDADALRRSHAIKLRDADSFGLPGWYRLGVLGPGAQDVLRVAVRTTVGCATALESVA